MPSVIRLALAAWMFFGALPMAVAASEVWLDLLRGEAVSEKTLLDDLASAQVIYVGEIHTIERHHQVQSGLLDALARQNPSLALGLEQIEAHDQPAVDRFNRREIDFDELAKEIDWAKQWKNFEQYRPLCETAQKLNIPVFGLNAPAPTIRAVGRGGLATLPADRRSGLPDEIVADDPAYEKLMNLMLAVHASMDPTKLRPIFEAQVARDETMAANIVSAMGGAASERRTVFVVCGRGHISYGLGTPDRVARRVPGVVQRILLVSEEGELVLGAKEEAMRREVSIRHEDLREIGRPLADYLRIRLRPAGEEAKTGE